VPDGENRCSTPADTPGSSLLRQPRPSAVPAETTRRRRGLKCGTHRIRPPQQLVRVHAVRQPSSRSPGSRIETGAREQVTRHRWMRGARRICPCVQPCRGAFGALAEGTGHSQGPECRSIWKLSRAGRRILDGGREETDDVHPAGASAFGVTCVWIECHGIGFECGGSQYPTRLGGEDARIRHCSEPSGR
jgi:hypothetical protein